MEAAIGAGAEARNRLAADMQKGLETARQAQQLALYLIAANQRDIVVEAEAVKGRRPPRPQSRRAVAGGGETVEKLQKSYKRPPSSNRGVK